MRTAISHTSWQGISAFLYRVRGTVQINNSDEELASALVTSAYSVDEGASLKHDADFLQPWIVGSGWACYARALSDGRRQIFSVILPGDTIGLCDEVQLAAESEVVALTQLKLLQAPRLRERLRQNEKPFSDLAIAMETERLLQHARLLDQIVRLGRLAAIERMAHFLMELEYRLRRSGLVEENTMPFPLTQAELADALGLSLVHVNRTLQALRHQGLISLGNRTMAIADRVRLARLADFRH